jgi:hypothetical protein
VSEKVKQPDLAAVLRRQANQIAVGVFEKHTTIRGKDAQRLAEVLVQELGPKLRAEQVATLSGMTARQVWALAGTGVTLLGLDLVVMAHAARRGNRMVRAAGVAAIGLRVAAAMYTQHRERRLRAAARLTDTGDQS